jgi:c-di-GMP-binding flagellar brake protein YcgR
MSEQLAAVPQISSSLIRLSAADVPIGEPLAWEIVTADGTRLFDTGAVLSSDAMHVFLFKYFEPFRRPESMHDAADDAPATTREIPVEPASAATEQLKLGTIGLEIDSRLGVRRQASSSMYSSRVIGFSRPGPNRVSAIFITQPVMSGYSPLELVRGEQVELVALTSRAVFRFACTVDFVCHEPFHYLVLSEPGTIQRLRVRKFARMSTRIAAHFFDVEIDDAPVHLGLIRDISPFGMSLAVAEPTAKMGDRLRVSFRFMTDGLDVSIDTRAIVRHVHVEGAHGGYGLEFESLEPSDRIALKSLMAEGR